MKAYDTEQLNERERHRWFTNYDYSLLVGSPSPVEVCEKCGIIRRKDGGNKPCPGEVSMAIRKGGKDE